MTRVLGRLRRTGGYTLVEMMLVMAILGIVMAGLTALFVSASNAELDMNLRWQAQQSARLSLDKLRREIHCASTVGSTTNDSSKPGPLSYNKIVVALPSGCTGGGGDITWCTQSLGTNRWGLYRVAGSACTGGIKYADYLTSPNIFGITTTLGSLTKVNLDIPVNRKWTKSTDQYRLQDDIVLRNSTRN